MAITFSFSGLEGQTFPSPEDDGIGPGHLEKLSLEEERKVAMVTLLFFSGVGRADLLFSRRYAMTTSTRPYSRKNQRGHGHPSLLPRCRKGRPPLR